MSPEIGKPKGNVSPIFADVADRKRARRRTVIGGIWCSESQDRGGSRGKIVLRMRDDKKEYFLN